MSSRAFVTIAPHVVPHLDRAVHRVTSGRKLLLTLPRPEVGLILTTTGAHSGRRRSTPLICVHERESATWLVVGSNFGKPAHPAWSGDLRADPRARISWQGQDHAVTAVPLSGRERELAWQAAVDLWPPYLTYQRRTEREIRLFRLVPAQRPESR